MRYRREIFSVPECSRLVKLSSNEGPMREHAVFYSRQKRTSTYRTVGMTVSTSVEAPSFDILCFFFATGK